MGFLYLHGAGRKGVPPRLRLALFGVDDIEVYIWDHNKERVFEWATTIIDDETDHMVVGIDFIGTAATTLRCFE